MENLSEKIPLHNSSRGFRRTEFLATVVCITVLAVILLIWRARSPELARRKACQNNIRQLLGCFDGYLKDNGRLPAAARSKITNDQDWIFWQPNRALEDSAIAHYTLKFDTNLLRCPGDDRVRYRTYQYSYTMNAHLEKQQKARLTRSKPLILIYEENDPNDGACAAGSSSDIVTTRHNAKSNAGFLDGHVERITQSTGSLDKHARP